ncbi:MAG: nodulation protein NfeD [Anaerolineaceae bacterium]|nr:nodulation protein NfeD [Anaerolineaceae bacterium]
MDKRIVQMLIFVLGMFCLVLPGQAVLAQNPGPTALVLTADGPLTPAMAEYLDRGLRRAAQEQAELLIFELNTPGGDINLMNRMVTSIRGSSAPVVVYVWPRGAMAGSAGTIITLAGHANAMAPETAIGAASPVGSQGQDIDTTEATKVKEMLKATVRTFSGRRPAGAISLAEATIDSAKAVSDQEALQAGLIDFIATDVNDLLRQLNGFKVTTSAGERTLNTGGIVVQPLQISFIEQLLQMLTNPNIVFLLLTLGVQAILIELSSPGGWVAGFVGAVALALAAYGLGILPVNWFGVVFLLLSFVLFFLDIKSPTHGALTAAGVVSFIIGALVMFNSPNVPAFQRVSVPLVVGTGLVTAAAFFTVVSFGLRAMRIPLRTGERPLIGKVGVVRDPLDPEGTVQVAGELWTAHIEEDEPTIPRGALVEVLGVEGVRLRVKPSTQNG